jgi:hypothetical protein
MHTHATESRRSPPTEIDEEDEVDKEDEVDEEDDGDGAENKCCVCSRVDRCGIGLSVTCDSTNTEDGDSHA